MYPPKSYVHPEPNHMTFFGNRVFANVISLVKMRSYWSRVRPNPMAGVLIKKQMKKDSHREKTAMLR